MKVLVTGSTGHLGEGLVRTLNDLKYEVTGLDILPSGFTTHQGSITNRDVVRACMEGVTTVFHTATLHKPHVATHSRQEFIDTNLSGTLNLLEEAVAAGVQSFIFTSTTSVFGDALVPPPGAPAAWITEDVKPVPKNIYGVTKAAAEDLCQLFYRNHNLACVVLRTSRFFPEADDDTNMRNTYTDDNLKVNELLFRRVDIEDTVQAHLAAARHARAIGFGKYTISATTPFTVGDLVTLRTDASAVVHNRVPGYKDVYALKNWKMFGGIDRVYVNEKARMALGWQPRYDFPYVMGRLRAGEDWRSPLARRIGIKGYHADTFPEGPYPV